MAGAVTAWLTRTVDNMNVYALDNVRTRWLQDHTITVGLVGLVVCVVMEASLVHRRRAQASTLRLLPRKAKLPRMEWYVGRSEACTAIVLCVYVHVSMYDVHLKWK